MVTHDNRILDIADRTINMEDGSLRSFVVKIEVVMNVKAAVAFEAGKPLTIETVQLEGPRLGRCWSRSRQPGFAIPTLYPLGADPGLFPAIHEVQALS